MNRRDFLTLAAGGTIALAVAEYFPIPLPVERTWTWVKMHDFVPVPDAPKYLGQLTALRSDGQWFAVACPLWKDDFTPEHIDTLSKNACLVLETFRNCACVTGHQCVTHAEMFPPDPDVTEDAGMENYGEVAE